MRLFVGDSRAERLLSFLHCNCSHLEMHQGLILKSFLKKKRRHNESKTRARDTKHALDTAKLWNNSFMTAPEQGPNPIPNAVRGKKTFFSIWLKNGGLTFRIALA